MIRFALICDRGHDFEAWFGSGAAYDEQAASRDVICPSCGSAEVSKAPMAPALRKHKAEPVRPRASDERKRTYAFLKGLRAHLEANAENVGQAFPDEARKMHYGESAARSIYGQASLDQARELKDEGIPAVPLPVLPEDHN